MESKTRRRVAFEFWVFHYIDNKPRRHKRNRRKERLKMGRKPERNSNKRIKTISGKGKKRYREKYKTLVRYRTGRKNDRIHLHGIFFGQKSAELIRKHWKYGFVFIGGYCNSRSVNYMTKYMLKVDIKHPEFKQIVLASAGIGAGYMDRLDYLWQKQNYKNINVATYTFRNGTKMAMPKYYKNKIFTEKEREKMWINNLNRGLLWIYGEKVKADDWYTIDNLRKYWQKYGREVMGDNPIAWNAMKTRRKEEKQRRAIAEAKNQLKNSARKI